MDAAYTTAPKAHTGQTMTTVAFYVILKVCTNVRIYLLTYLLSLHLMQ